MTPYEGHPWVAQDLRKINAQNVRYLSSYVNDQKNTAAKKATVLETSTPKLGSVVLMRG